VLWIKQKIKSELFIKQRILRPGCRISALGKFYDYDKKNKDDRA
jgi:hypothetical protein